MTHKKILPYSTQYIDSSDIRAVTDVLRSDWITQGPAVRVFEEKLASYCGTAYAAAVSSGTAALHIACLAAGIEKGDEVITSPITFAASANCVLYCGGKPVFADIQKDTANIEPDEIRRKITKKTKAIIPVHFAGHPCDMEEIRKIAKARRLMIIEDAAHALGAEYKGDKTGSSKYSDMTIFSFHPVKSITTGEGGAILTNRKDIYENLVMLRNHGITKDKELCGTYDGAWYYEMQVLGFNYRITDIQSSLGTSQLKKLDRFIEKRGELADFYNKAFSGRDDIILPVEKSNVKSSWHLYVIRLKHGTDIEKKRKNIFDYLRKNNIGAHVHYIPVYRHPFYRKLGYKAGICPEAENYYKRAISLPIHPRMEKGECRYAAEAVIRALEKFNRC